MLHSKLYNLQILLGYMDYMHVHLHLHLQAADQMRINTQCPQLHSRKHLIAEYLHKTSTTSAED